jgi:hypothetical protein
VAIYQRVSSLSVLGWNALTVGLLALGEWEGGAPRLRKCYEASAVMCVLGRLWYNLVGALQVRHLIQNKVPLVGIK